MTEIKDIIAKLKAQQSSQPSEKPVVKEVKEEEVEVEEEEDEEETKETPKEEKRVELTREQQIVMEIEMLQNNGRFRAELLHQLQEHNRIQLLIADAIVSILGYVKGK